MFDFITMGGNYEERAVDRFEGPDGLIIDTAAVTDSEKPYETGILHPEYNDGKWIIVELYDTKEAAQTGHDEWVKKMTSGELPEKLVDVSLTIIAAMLDDECGDNEWRTYPRKGIGTP